MNILKNRKAAIAITIAVLVLATLFGVQKSLNALARDVESMFYDGVYIEANKATQPSVQSQLDKCADQAFNLATLLNGHPELAGKAEEVLTARRDLLDAQDPTSKFLPYNKMFGGVIYLVSAAQNAELTEREMAAVSQYNTAFMGAAGLLDTLCGSYGEKVSEYWDGQSFIARMIGSVTGVTGPREFKIPVVLSR